MNASNALAVLFAPPPDGGGGLPLSALLLQFAAIFLIFYFIWFRPQQRQRRQFEETIRSVKKGDEIVTAGGIVGEVLHIKESVKDGQPSKSMEDRITIKSGDSRLVIERGRIARVVTPKAAETSTA
jgi:preprotein translocase subunit YajC